MPQTRERTAPQFFRACSFKRTGMGGNTQAWFLHDRALAIEIVVTNGDYRAPLSWNTRASVGVSIVDDRGPISTWGREFATVEAFRAWFDEGAGTFLQRTHPEVTDAELVAAGFRCED